MGKLPESERRSTQIQIRISRQGAALIRRAAKVAGKSVSSFLRDAALKSAGIRNDRG